MSPLWSMTIVMSPRDGALAGRTLRVLSSCQVPVKLTGGSAKADRPANTSIPSTSVATRRRFIEHPSRAGWRSAARRRPPRFERDRDVPILSPLAEQLFRVRQLVGDLEQIAVRIAEVDALLAHVVDRARDLHAVLLERVVGVLERRVARDLERDVGDAALARRLAPHHVGVLAREQVDRVARALERHEDPA